jgi:hypothetical protein
VKGKKGRERERKKEGKKKGKKKEREGKEGRREGGRKNLLYFLICLLQFKYVCRKIYVEL